MPRFVCLWIPHFEAWAAARYGLGDKLDSLRSPFVIASRDHVVAACPVAQNHSVQTNLTLSKARALAPDLQVIPFHLPTVQMAWDEVLQSLYSLTPLIESLRPGLLLADLHRPSLLVPLLRQWQAHGGVADDRTTAEIAAYTAATRTLRSVRTGCSIAFLRRTSVTVFSEMGVNPEGLQRLGWFGWHTIADLHPLTQRQLVTQFEQGELLYRYAQANDTRPVAPYHPSPHLHTRLSFDEPVREFHEIAPALPVLVTRLEERLNGRTAQTITVAVENGVGVAKQQRILRDATTSAITLCRIAEELLLLLFNSRRPVTRLEIILGGLGQPTPQQGTLFGRRRPSVVEAVRAVERRFPAALQHFVVADPQAYLPEHFARLEPLTVDTVARSQCNPSQKLPASRRRSSHVRRRASQRNSRHTTAFQPSEESSVVVQP